MERYRSTFAVTGIAALGLLAAAGILHPGNFERQTARSPAAAAAAATAWVDPPASRGAAPRRPTSLSDTAALMKPEPTLALAADYAMVRLLPAEMTLVATTPRSPRLAHAAKPARRAATTRQAALGRPVGDEAGAAQAGNRSDAGGEKIDPIGDLIRGLGLSDRS